MQTVQPRLGPDGSVTDRRTARSAARAAALIAAILLTAAAVGLWSSNLAPLSVPALTAAATVATAICAGAWFTLARQRWFSSTAQRWLGPELALFLIAVVGTCSFFVPVGWGRLLALPGIPVLALVILGALIAGIVKVRQRPGLFVASALLALLAVPVAVDAWSPASEPGLRFRLSFFEDQYRSEAADLIAHPPPEPATHVAQDVILGYGPNGEPSVAWVWVHGIPARDVGVVFDRDGVMAEADSNVVGTDDLYGWSQRRCDHLDGPWYWCRVY